jgi:hypothetical protein
VKKTKQLRIEITRLFSLHTIASLKVSKLGLHATRIGAVVQYL